MQSQIPIVVAPATEAVAISGQQAPLPPVVAVGLDWPVLIPLIVAGIIGVIGAVSSAAIAWSTKKSTAVAATAIQSTNAAQILKLDSIQVLVNGRYSAVLQELADVKRLLAQATGLSIDRRKAEDAQLRADEQIARAVTASAAAMTAQAAAAAAASEPSAVPVVVAPPQ